jgi:hypothetical protein
VTRETLTLPHAPLTDRQAAALAGELGERPLDARHYELVVGSPRAAGVQVVRDGRGETLLVYVRRAVRPGLAGEACRDALRRAARPSTNQGDRRTGTVGFMPRGRCAYCRRCAYNRDDPEGWAHVHRLLRSLVPLYCDELPAEYGRQAAYARACNPDYVVGRTPFSTAAVNLNEAREPHRHPDNLALGFSVMAVLRRGDSRGCLLVLPQHRLAVDAGDLDVVMFRGTDWHGNTALLGCGERITVVAYFLADVIDCGSAEDEYRRASGLG